MKQISSAHLDELVVAAQASSRRRANLNLHQTLADPVQRLAIAMEPDTLILPHHHAHTWELLYPVRGRFVVLSFDDGGVVTERAVLGEQTTLVEIAAGQWHAVLSLDVGGVIFEVKCGPYRPLDPADSAPCLAGAPAPSALLGWYRSARSGASLAEVQ